MKLSTRPLTLGFKVAFIYFKTSEAVLQAGLYKAKLLGELASWKSHR